jgi:cellulose synthase/poly-beta-1,6-N-acetylglucosamine synthase-like glycosyltransferase
MLQDDAEVQEINAGVGQPRISVLMPVFEQKRFIAAALRSILEQRGITAELLISDDASGDDSFAEVLACIGQALRQGPVRHRIILRRGRKRLWRNHLPLLAEMAQCDLLCQAHGDDISHPERLHYIVAGFDRYPGCTMVSAGHTNILGDTGETGTTVRGAGFPLNDQTIIRNHPNLIGCNVAWRRSALACFPRLDTSFAAAAHDRILAFRAYLAGSILLLDMPLVMRRRHALQAHVLSFAEPGSNGQFGWNLANLAHFEAMTRDLDTALTCGLITAERHRVLAGIMSASVQHATREIVSAYNRHTNAGLHVAWVDRRTIIQLRGG